MAAGGRIIELSDNLLEHTAMQFANDAVVTTERPSGWDSLKRMLDRVNPGFGSCQPAGAHETPHGEAEI